MTTKAIKAKLKAIQSLRALFLQETSFQIRYDACHERGWTDSYLLTLDGSEVGYGSVKGRENSASRNTVFEFFVARPFRKYEGPLFRELLAVAGTAYVECQSNDRRLTSLLFEHARDIAADTILFADHATTAHAVPGAEVRARRRGDAVFAHHVERVGDYVAVQGGEVGATGGFLCHYNPPFADLYMEVRADRRRRSLGSLGSLLIQEVKKACYLAGRVPAARCDLQNAASRATLEKAGLRVCGYMLTGRVAGA